MLSNGGLIHEAPSLREGREKITFKLNHHCRNQL
jgi:hypothetical protein